MSKQERDLLKQLWAYLAIGQAPEKADVIFAFGGLDMEVPKKAAKLYKAQIANIVVVTGGAGAFSYEVHSTKPEAEVFAEILRNEGVPGRDILVEPRAANTGQNVEFSMQLIEETGVQVERAVLVARPFLMRRVVATFQKQYPKVDLIPCPPYEELETYLDFAKGRAKYRILAEIERIRTYPFQGFMVQQEIPLEVEQAVRQLKELCD